MLASAPNGSQNRMNVRSSSPSAEAMLHSKTNIQALETALCRICEPIAFMSIFPYVYYMIRSFEITSDDRRIAVYAGMVTSAFAFAEFSTGVIWGRLSDKVGRKPILISGLAGTALSMLVFGFAQSLPVALVGRALGGLLNGCRLKLPSPVHPENTSAHRKTTGTSVFSRPL